MPARRDPSDADKVMHIVATYGLGLPPAALASIRKQCIDFTCVDSHLILEERAAMCLTRYLYPAVLSELGAASAPAARSELLVAWSKFAQQAMYRSDLGLINMAQFDGEILPLIDEVERRMDAALAAAEGSSPHSEGSAGGNPR